MAYLDDVIEDKINKMQFVRSEKKTYARTSWLTVCPRGGCEESLNYIIANPTRFTQQQVDAAVHYLKVSDWQFAEREIGPLHEAAQRDQWRLSKIANRKEDLEDPNWIAKKIQEEAGWYKFWHGIDRDPPVQSMYTEEYFRLPIEQQIEMELDKWYGGSE